MNRRGFLTAAVAAPLTRRFELAAAATVLYWDARRDRWPKRPRVSTEVTYNSQHDQTATAPRDPRDGDWWYAAD